MNTYEYKKAIRSITESIDSRYYGSELVEDSGILFRTTYDPKPIPIKDTDSYFQVRADEVGRLDLVAVRAYKNSKLYWVIALANEIINPIEEIVVGMVLRIPKYTESLNAR